MAKGCAGCRDGAGFDLAITTAFQPIVDTRTNTVVAYEALVRGQGGEGAADVLAQVNDRNRYAFDQLCRVTAIRDAVAAGLLDTDAKLSINFLPNAVYSPLACIRLTLDTAREVGLPPNRLVFEFTENEEIEPDHLRSIIQAYRALGFGTALDDFGAGHSGLQLLANFRTDGIKLDLSLVRGIDGDWRRQQIVRAILILAEGLGTCCTVEGVETEAEALMLRSLGARYMQGFLFAPPAVGMLPAPHFALADAQAA